MEDLAWNYRHSGRLQDAVVLFKSVVEARRRTLGSGHEDTLKSMYDFAWYYEDHDGSPEAADLYEDM